MASRPTLGRGSSAPDPAINQIYLYSLGLAAQRTRVELVHATTMSNHEHALTHDREGTRVEFYQYLQALVARATQCAAR